MQKRSQPSAQRDGSHRMSSALNDSMDSFASSLPAPARSKHSPRPREKEHDLGQLRTLPGVYLPQLTSSRFALEGDHPYAYPRASLCLSSIAAIAGPFTSWESQA